MISISWWTNQRFLLAAELQSFDFSWKHPLLISSRLSMSLSLIRILPWTVVTSVFGLSSLLLVGSGPLVAAQAGVSLVEDNISHVADKVIDSQALEEDVDEVNWERTWLLRLPVVSAQYWPCCLGLYLFIKPKVNVVILARHRGWHGTYLFSWVVLNLRLLLGGSGVFGGRGGGWHGCQCHGGCCWSTHSPGPR